MTAQMQAIDDIRTYVFAGRSTFTLVSRATGNRYTFRISRAPGENDGRPWFVTILRGPDNHDDYTFLGTVFPDSQGRYRHGKKSKINFCSRAVKTVAWFLRKLEEGDLSQVEFWHEGSCGRCGRKLTVPESIATGMGPVCATM